VARAAGPAHQHDQQARSRMRSTRSSNDSARVPDLLDPHTAGRTIRGPSGHHQA
jgi:hypothetical protein